MDWIIGFLVAGPLFGGLIMATADRRQQGMGIRYIILFFVSGIIINILVGILLFCIRYINYTIFLYPVY